MSGVYIDLFDDGLCDWSSGPGSNFETLKNHLRLVVFTSILFERRIVVPEQWAVSSAACIDVLGEVAAGYRLHARGCEDKAEAKAPLPFEFVCFPRSQTFAAAGEPRRALAAALFERAGSGRRLRTSAAVDTETNRPVERREALTALMGEALESRVGEAFHDGFEDRLGEILDDPGRAARLASLLRHNEQTGIVTRVDYDSYGALLRRHYDAVRHGFERIEFAKDDDLRAYREFFEIVERDGIPGHEYARMLRAIYGRAPEAVASIEHVFRHGMHDALSGLTGARSTTLTFGAYEKTPSGPFEEALTLAAVSSRGADGAAFSAAEADAFALLTRAAPKSARLSALWTDEWRKLFDMARSADFIILRGRVYAEAGRLRTKTGGADVAALDDLMAHVLKRLDAFDFKRRRQGRIEILLNARYGMIEMTAGGLALGGGLAAIANPVAGAILGTASGLLLLGKTAKQSGLIDRAGEALGRMRQLIRPSRAR